jgi:hypothetical protein
MKWLTAILLAVFAVLYLHERGRADHAVKERRLCGSILSEDRKGWSNPPWPWRNAGWQKA